MVPNEISVVVDEGVGTESEEGDNTRDGVNEHIPEDTLDNNDEILAQEAHYHNNTDNSTL